MEYIFPAALLTVSGLWFLSYRHYESYRKLAHTLLVTLFVMLFACFAWNDVMQRIKRDTRAEILNIKIDKLTATNYKEIEAELRLGMVKSDMAESSAEKASAIISSYELNMSNILIAYILSGVVLLGFLFSPLLIKDHPHNTKQVKEN